MSSLEGHLSRDTRELFFKAGLSLNDRSINEALRYYIGEAPNISREKKANALISRETRELFFKAGLTISDRCINLALKNYIAESTTISKNKKAKALLSAEVRELFSKANLRPNDETLEMLLNHYMENPPKSGRKLSLLSFLEQRTKDQFYKGGLKITDETIYTLIKHYNSKPPAEKLEEDLGDQLRSFVEDLEFSEDYRENSRDLYEAYIEHCFFNDVNPIGRIKFNKYLDSLQGVTSAYLGKNIRTTLGVRIKR